MKILIPIFLIIMSSCKVFTQSSVCGNPYFEHKSEAKIAAMSPEEKMDQMVLEQMFHAPWDNDDNYDLLHLKIIEDSNKVLPTAIKYLNEYDPNVQKCKERSNTRMFTAAMYLNNVDNAKFRIRSTETGRLAIRSLEQVIERRRKAKLNPDEYDGRGNLLTTFLKGLKGQNIKDGLIEETLEKRYNVKMSEAELMKFTDFLISLDSAYPGWTNIFFWGEMTQAESDRYYQAYLKFKKIKR